MILGDIEHAKLNIRQNEQQRLDLWQLCQAEKTRLERLRVELDRALYTGSIRRSRLG